MNIFWLPYFHLFSIVMVSIPKNWCAKNVFCHLKILYLFENISISSMKMNIKSVRNVIKKPGQDLSIIFALNPNPICAKCASKLLIVFASTEYICAPTQVRHRTLAVYEVAGRKIIILSFIIYLDLSIIFYRTQIQYLRLRTLANSNWIIKTMVCGDSSSRI